MMAGLAADAVLLLHLLFILFVLLGGFGVLYRRWLVWLHLPAATWGAVVELCQLQCPLTPLENSLRRLAGEAGYSGGFVEHYLLPIIYPVGLTQAHQLWLGVAVLVLNGAIYGLVFWWLNTRR